MKEIKGADFGGLGSEGSKGAKGSKGSGRRPSKQRGASMKKCTTALADKEKAIAAAPSRRLVFISIVVTYCFTEILRCEDDSRRREGNPVMLTIKLIAVRRYIPL